MFWWSGLSCARSQRATERVPPKLLCKFPHLALSHRSFARVDPLNAVTLVAEGAGVCEVDPVTLTVVNIPWRTAPALVVRDIDGRWATFRHNEDLMGKRRYCAQIFRSMDTSAFLEGLSHGG